MDVRYFGFVATAGYSEANLLALQRAVGHLRAGGGTLFIPAGVYDLAGTVDVEGNMPTGAAGALRTIGRGGSILPNSDERSSS